MNMLSDTTISNSNVCARFFLVQELVPAMAAPGGAQ
jgi:hypothetical protein